MTDGETLGATDGGISDPHQLPTGALVDRRFRISEVAGHGAFGTVYRAIDTTTARDVALKVLHRETLDYARFEREVEVLATIRHHHVVSYVAHGLTDHGQPYLAMEWLEGVDLARHLAQQPMAIREALIVAARAAQGLAAAHALGIVHRDVKPSNIQLVGGNPEDVRVLDFGIARITGAHSKLTATGTLIGTPAYMAPEQARGATDLSARVDVFALGCVLFECLAGAPPFAEPGDRSVFGRLLAGAAPRLSERRADSPPVLDVLLSRMLAHDPADRFPDGAAVALAISGLLSDGTRLPKALSGGAILSDRAAIAYSSFVARSDAALAASVDEVIAAAGGDVRHRDTHAVVAVFSAPRSEAAALRAVRCALAARDRDRQLRIAVTSAQTDTIVANGSGIVEGARGGDIVLDATTAAHVAREYDVERRGPVALLGRARAPGADAALVGRVRELATLEGIWAEVVGERCARVALVVGEAGIGKSRLLRELIRRISPAVVARGDRPTSTSPFAIVAQLVQAWAPGDLDAARARLRELGVTEVECDFLCELAGLRPDDAAAPHLHAARRDPMQMADAFRTAWLALVEAKLAAGPLLIAVEDLHEADLASVRLLDAALEQLAGRSLLVVATARVDEGATLDTFAARDPEQIVLKPLRANVAIELLRGALPRVTDEQLDRIVSRVGGNPLRLLELARLGVDETSPGSVRAAIEARLMRLDPFARRVLRAGSVFGIRFAFDGLLELVGGAARRTDVETALGAAEREQFVTRDGELWAFQHGLIQEASYAMLDPAERRAAHAAVGHWLATRPGCDPSLVAWHFEQAEEREHAFGWYEAAARAALQGRDLERALRLCAAAMACDPRGDDLARVALLQAEAAFYRGDAPGGRTAATDAMAAAEPGSGTWTSAAGVLVTSAGQTGDNAEVARLAELVRTQRVRPEAAAQRVVCLCRAATQLMSIGQHPIARALLAEATAEDIADPLARAWSHRLRAALQVLDEDYGAAFVTQAEAIRWFVVAGDGRGSCLARILQSSVAVFGGDVAAANTELDIAEQVARRTGADYLLRWAAYTRGKILALFGEPAAARAHLARVRAELAGNPRIVAGTHVYGALAALRAGDSAWAESEARAGLAAHGAPATRAVCLAALARALVMAGRAAEATEPATEAAAILASVGRFEENESVVHLAVIEAALANGNEAEARAAAERALARLVAIANRLATPARREAMLHGIDSHRQTLAVASRLGLAVPAP